MSVRKENYLIYGCKFGEEFTNEFWQKDFRDEMEWDEDKPNDKPYFITDGMNGNYTFFGFICQLSNGGDDDYEAKEIDFQYNDKAIWLKLWELYPNTELPDIKMWYLPHYV
jgi:hypothetical protein